MANMFRLGTLALNGQLVVPSDTGSPFGGEIPEILNTVKGKDLHWVVVGGKLIASKCLLRNISFHDLDALGLVGPTEIQIDGEDYILRLLKVGRYEGEPNEWDAAIDDTGVNNAIWHWDRVYAWGMDELSTPYFRAIRGGDGPRDRECSSTWNRENTGWRPVLEPVPVKLSQRLRGKKVAVWHGQQILYGRVASYNAYDLYLTDAQPLFSTGFDRMPWYADLGESCLVVDRNQIAAIQLR